MIWICYWIESIKWQCLKDEEISVEQQFDDDDESGTKLIATKNYNKWIKMGMQLNGV